MTHTNMYRTHFLPSNRPCQVMANLRVAPEEEGGGSR